MNLTATITRRIPIHQLRPGALVRGHTVDSIEIAADGAAAWCWPPGRSSGRRVRLPLGALDGEVTVSAGPGDDTEQLIRELGRLIGVDGAAIDLENALLAVELPSGWTFALHGDEQAPEPTEAPPAPDEDNEED